MVIMLKAKLIIGKTYVFLVMKYNINGDTVNTPPSKKKKNPLTKLVLTLMNSITCV